MNGDIETIYVLIRAIRACFHLLGNVGDDLHREYGLTTSMRAVMESLYEGGAQTVPQIARSKSVTRQHIQTLVDQLLEGGLAAAVPNPDHKRSPLIELTPKGHRSFEDMQRREHGLLIQLSAGLPAKDLMLAVETIQRLNEQLQQLRKGGKENEPSFS